jgi:hypothetical protein
MDKYNEGSGPLFLLFISSCLVAWALNKASKGNSLFKHRRH